jgi:hypothetical protein
MRVATKIHNLGEDWRDRDTAFRVSSQYEEQVGACVFPMPMVWLSMFTPQTPRYRSGKGKMVGTVED